MKKEFVLAAMLIFGSSSLFAGACSDTKVEFTFYGASDKSYIVEGNTFKSIKASGDTLNGASVEIDLTTIDTSANKYGAGSPTWPASMVAIRDMNTRNHFFGAFANKIAKAKIVAVSGNSVDVEIMANGVTQKIKMTKDSDGKYAGKLDVMKFSSAGWNKFAGICKSFHKGASHSEIDLFFSVPVSCK